MEQSLALQRYHQLYIKGLHSDVKFYIGKEEQREIILAHKCILSIASPVFASHFTKSADVAIRIMDVSPRTFRGVLQYIYTDKVHIHEYNWADILYASDKFRIDSLKSKCLTYIKSLCVSILDIKGLPSLENSITFEKEFTLCLEALNHNVLDLIPFLKIYFLCYPKTFLSSMPFLSISSNTTLDTILSCDNLNCDEIEVFRAAMNWASLQLNGKKGQLREVLGPALFAIRFTRISPNDFVEEVIPSGVLTEKEITDVLMRKIPGKSKETILDFPSYSRLRTCYGFNYRNWNSFNSYHLGIRFQVDRPILIHAFIIYAYKKIGLKRRLILKSCSDLKTSSWSAIIDVNREPVKYFNEAIPIQANTWYLAASLEVDNTSNMDMNVKWSNISNEKVDGVKWKFEHSSRVHCHGIGNILFSSLN